MSTGGTGSFSRCRASSMPSMSGMWMSVSTRSAGVVPSNVSASRPLPASPTTRSGTALVQSSSNSRSRRRAGASSSTMSTRNGASGMVAPADRSRPIWHPDVHFVSLPVDLALEPGLGIEMQREPFADVGKCHLVAAAVPTAVLVRVAQYRMHFAAAKEDINRDHPGRARRFDAMVDRVLEQWLQHQGRHQRVPGHVVDVPFDAEAVAEP